MSARIAVIAALVRKDLKGLLPLVIISLVAYFVVPLVSSLDLTGASGDNAFWTMLQRNIYWLGFFLGAILMVSVLQQDPADSLNHDWLTRPIGRHEWILGKLLFLLVAFLLPMLIARVVIGISAGMSPGLAVSYAAGVEEFEAVFLLPLLFMAALLAPNIRKLILLLVGVFFLFLLPGWSVTRPLLMQLGIELSGELGGMIWMQVVVVIMAGLAGSALIYWFLYCRRRTGAAYISFWCAVLLMFVTIYPPQSLYNWDNAVALQSWLINDENAALEEQIVLDPLMACFPAARMDSDSTSEQELALLQQAAWLPEVLGPLQPGTLTIATPVAYRQQLTEWLSPANGSRDHSVEWRLDRLLTRARFSADSLPGDVPLRQSFTHLDRFQPVSVVESNYWLLPGDVLAQVADDPSARLILNYDLALLSPKAFELPVDGQRYTLPELGSCMAEQDSATNRITVECLKRGVQPELVSAQFIGMDSSRVDSYSRSTLTHDWIEALKRQRYELTLEMAGLTETSSIIVTAYNIERIVRKELAIPGVLGSDLDKCPLPGGSDDQIAHTASWSDASPHEVSSVAVGRGVRLEVLDWRTEIKPDAPTLVLLPGLGATAHAYDRIAPQLAQHYNVIGVTRRGTGGSSKPGQGYDIAQLSADVLAVMDSYGIASAFFVGHSYGGEELSFLGANHPAQVEGLIYLDAAYDRVSVNSGDALKRSRQLDVQLPPPPPVRPAERASYQAMDAYVARTGRGPKLPEGEIIASYDLNTGTVRHDALYMDALMMGVIAPQYKRITAPALAMYAVPTSPRALEETWYDPRDTHLQSVLDELFQLDRERKLAEIKKFESEVADSQVIVLDDADHWIFMSHEDEVLDALKTFIDDVLARRVARR